MSFSARILFVLLWVASIIIVAALASAQVLQYRSDPGAVISGSDIGFRPDGWAGTARTGRLVVRINGQWVDAKASGVVTQAGQQ